MSHISHWGGVRKKWQKKCHVLFEWPLKSCFRRLFIAVKKMLHSFFAERKESNGCCKNAKCRKETIKEGGGEQN